MQPPPVKSSGALQIIAKDDTIQSITSRPARRTAGERRIDMENFKRCGTVSGTGVEIVELANGKRYALDAWNGERFYGAYEVDKCGVAVNPQAPALAIAPVYKQVGDDEFEIFDYEID